MGKAKSRTPRKDAAVSALAAELRVATKRLDAHAREISKLKILPAKFELFTTEMRGNFESLRESMTAPLARLEIAQNAESRKHTATLGVLLEIAQAQGVLLPEKLVAAAAGQEVDEQL